MKYSGLYYVNNPSASLDDALKTVTTLVQGIESAFPTATRQPPWSLTYRVFRDTPARESTPADAEGKPRPHAHSYQHIFHLSSIAPSRAHIYIQPPEGSGIVTAIPLQQQDVHASLLRYQYAALWTPRHVLAVQQGTTYKGGLFTVQIGELRATREGPQSGGTQSPGIVVCISTAVGGGDEDDEQNLGHTPPTDDTTSGDESVDFEYAQATIRDFWAKIIEGRDLGRSEAREVMMAPENVKGEKEKEKDAAVRMWCEALRLRGGLPVRTSKQTAPVINQAAATFHQTAPIVNQRAPTVDKPVPLLSEAVAASNVPPPSTIDLLNSSIDEATPTFEWIADASDWDALMTNATAYMFNSTIPTADPTTAPTNLLDSASWNDSHDVPIAPAASTYMHSCNQRLLPVQPPSHSPAALNAWSSATPTTTHTATPVTHQSATSAHPTTLTTHPSTPIAEPTTPLIDLTTPPSDPTSHQIHTHRGPYRFPPLEEERQEEEVARESDNPREGISGHIRAWANQWIAQLYTETLAKGRRP